MTALFVSRDVEQIIRLLDMLKMARVIYGVAHSAGNGIPLGAETNTKDRKPLFLDVGLLCCALGLKATDIHQGESLILVNRGAVAWFHLPSRPSS